MSRTTCYCLAIVFFALSLVMTATGGQIWVAFFIIGVLWLLKGNSTK